MADETDEEKDLFSQIIEAIDDAEVEPDRHVSIQLETSLKDAIHAARMSGKKAIVTVKVHVKPEHERRVQFSATVDAKLPRPSVSAATLFADDRCQLHRSDPAQLRMTFPKPIPLTPQSKES